jgi:hypothetical protein
MEAVQVRPPANSWYVALGLTGLIAHGHPIPDAEAIASRLPAYAAADPAHIAAFARANVTMWNEIESNNPLPWTVTMATATRAWRSTARPCHLILRPPTS